MSSSSKSEPCEDLDWEWAYLIFKARSLGVTIEEIRQFLSENSIQNQNHF